MLIIGVNYCLWDKRTKLPPTLPPLTTDHVLVVKSVGTRINDFKIDNYSRLPLIKTVTFTCVRPRATEDMGVILLPFISYLKYWSINWRFCWTPSLFTLFTVTIFARIATCHPGVVRRRIYWSSAPEIDHVWSLWQHGDWCDPWPCQPPHVSPCPPRHPWQPPITAITLWC